ncbi:pleckstrin homology domain-containing family A member 3 isoform X2 [Scyliorhinus canicula]|uniref:pleckstrin homology domain-containing family A member 3 isoform X2 n=1 Tax=Scyliorhinus canicula TaxID=7830 RepID=UPI0018F5A355|nr:pleckstrin homology domain-containing family A member 3 isoform X2 [Scyliorhinus canicula]
MFKGDELESELGKVRDVVPSRWTKRLLLVLGWQPRWFILDNGILSYYDSQDDVNKGSKGSIKMAVCEIKVHPTDSTRMELIIPGEQHFYVKSVNAAERQRWLVALGSSKACLTDTRTKKEKEISETNDSLKTKMSELRLYCDLLMQQVQTIQESVKQDQPSFSSSAENMNEASSLLSATCNTFITTLDECMKIANAKFKPEMFQLSHTDPLVSPVSPTPVQMVRMKRSISHPGTILYDGKLNTNHQKEAIIVTPHGEEHRIWEYSGAESYRDSALEHAEKTAQISCSSSPTANGELPPMTIPEENIGNSRNTLSETESPLVALSS